MKIKNVKTRKIIIIASVVAILIATVLIVFALLLKNRTSENSPSEEGVVSGASQEENTSIGSYFDAGKKASSSQKTEESSNSASQSSADSKNNSVSGSNDAKKPSKSDNSSSSAKETKESPPEKVTKVFPFENKFVMPEVKKEVFYDSKNGNTLPYCLFMPENYNPSKKYPVILFLHGAGEIGSDNEMQLNNIGKMFEYNSDLTSNAFILCPQTNEWWNLDRQYQGDQGGTLGSALHLLEKITQTYSCDSNRIYVTGLSMGGYATWSLLEEYGNIFAAGIPICGGGNYYNAAALKDIPIRIYHGTADPTVPFSASQNMYIAIKAAGGQKVDFIELAGVAHNAWGYAFSDRDTFSWLFAQNKATNPTCEYEYVHYFKVEDSKGNVVISDEDVTEAINQGEFGEKYIITVNLILTENGKQKLSRAYTSSGGKPFTVYWGNQKLYTFTATNPPKSNVFSMVDIFDEGISLHFCDQINTLGN